MYLPHRNCGATEPLLCQVERTFPLRAAAERSCLLYPNDCLHVANLRFLSQQPGAMQTRDKPTAASLFSYASSPSLCLSSICLAVEYGADDRATISLHPRRRPALIAVFTLALFPVSSFPSLPRPLSTSRETPVFAKPRSERNTQHEREPHRSVLAQSTRERPEQKPSRSVTSPSKAQSKRMQIL